MGIGIPFILKYGGNPVVIGALGMTAGYCGTLVTPNGAFFTYRSYFVDAIAIWSK